MGPSGTAVLRRVLRLLALGSVSTFAAFPVLLFLALLFSLFMLFMTPLGRHFPLTVQKTDRVIIILIISYSAFSAPAQGLAQPGATVTTVLLHSYVLVGVELCGRLLTVLPLSPQRDRSPEAGPRAGARWGHMRVLVGAAWPRAPAAPPRVLGIAAPPSLLCLVARELTCSLRPSRMPWGGNPKTQLMPEPPFPVFPSLRAVQPGTHDSGLGRAALLKWTPVVPGKSLFLLLRL